METSRIPEDVNRALTSLRSRARRHSEVTLHATLPPSRSWGAILQSPGPTRTPPDRSAEGSGREVHLRLEVPSCSSQVALGLLWGLAIPCGFVPWQRYPEVGHADMVFHYWGPWKQIEDNLLSSGRGEAIWPSLCALSQCEAGIWEGSLLKERLLQGHLHRAGFGCGPVDGIVGPQTKQALAACGLGGLSVSEALCALEKRSTPVNQTAPLRRGRLDLDRVVVRATGGIRVTRSPQGHLITVTGEGRLIVDVSA